MTLIYRVMKLEERSGKWLLRYLTEDKFLAHREVRYLRSVFYKGTPVKLEVWTDEEYNLALREDMVRTPKFGEGTYG